MCKVYKPPIIIITIMETILKKRINALTATSSTVKTYNNNNKKRKFNDVNDDDVIIDIATASNVADDAEQYKNLKPCTLRNHWLYNYLWTNNCYIDTNTAELIYFGSDETVARICLEITNLPIAKMIAVNDNNKKTIIRDHKLFKEQIVPQLLDKYKYQINKDSEWVSATKTFNYIRSDCLIDWLSYYVGHPSKLTTPIVPATNTTTTNYNNQITSFIMKQGLRFEENVIDQLLNKFGNDNMITISTGPEAHSKKRVQETISAMRSGIPIIYQGVLHNIDNKTYGIPDLIVRSDWLNRIFNINCINEVEATNGCVFHKKYHYRIVDIKLSTLYFNVDLRTLRNSGNIKCYKSQVAIYNAAIGTVQDYTPNAAYILGRQWKSDKKGPIRNPFDRAGVVDFTGFDYPSVENASDAIDWIRRMKAKGSNWSIDPPSIPELYPNMNNEYDSPWHGVKRRLAVDNADITLLWNCGPSHREYSLQRHNIDKWSDPGCTIDTLGMTGVKRRKVLDAILKINKNSSISITPKKIKNVDNRKLLRKSDGDIELFIDIEAVNDVITFEPGQPIVFMIGIGYEDRHNHLWKYTSFCPKTLTYESERDMLNKFNEWLSTTFYNNDNIRFFHWGHYDRSMMLKKVNALNKHEWVDLNSIFKAEPIAIRGAFNYGIKEIGRAMYRHGMITEFYDESSDVSNGLDAMIAAYHADKDARANGELLENNEIIRQSIRPYNEMDCKLVWQILTYIRKNHLD